MLNNKNSIFSFVVLLGLFGLFSSPKMAYAYAGKTSITSTTSLSKLLFNDLLYFYQLLIVVQATHV